jgi:type II restriction enzyme
MLTATEIKKIAQIKNAYYMPPLLAKIEEIATNVGYDGVLDNLHDILRNCQSDVEKILELRKASGEIKDIAQARKSVVGSIFSLAIVYCFLQKKALGELRENLFLTDNTKSKVFKEFTTIEVDGETQKPDMDLVFWSGKETEAEKCMIVSLKTSLRERAGQTYKWKLLLEIATADDCSVKEKYNIRHISQKMPLVCFATVNFYHEIDQPQHRGMFKFFDGAFIGKPIERDFIQPLSQLFVAADQRL